MQTEQYPSMNWTLIQQALYLQYPKKDKYINSPSKYGPSRKVPNEGVANRKGPDLTLSLWNKRTRMGKLPKLPIL